ncbi:fasciclin domain-containing protein [Scytonema sp. PCC 10023]|uniref:fasciclin domain-containing protein n=1 Tax=Scytonema sp. PCC 10023 TaxID=1680591 RepID=UPI0039C6EC4C
MTKKFKKLAFVLGIAGISTLISIPVLAKKFYPPYALFQPSAYRSYPYRNSEKNIADTLADNSKYSNLVYELKQAGLLEKLKQGQFTIFAPTDNAFKALPKQTYQRYSQKENREKVLKYHVVSGIITEKTHKNLNGTPIPTLLEGNAVKITFDKNGNVKLNNAIGKPPSIQAKNGVIIEINQVLVPPGL